MVLINKATAKIPISRYILYKIPKTSFYAQSHTICVRHLPGGISLRCCASLQCPHWTRFWLQIDGHSWTGSGCQSGPACHCCVGRSSSESSAKENTTGNVKWFNQMYFFFQNKTIPPVSDLVVLVVDAEPLPQVSEHHGTVLFELKATRQVFSELTQRKRF